MERPDDAVARFPELQHSSKRVDEGIDPMTSFRIETESDSAVADAIDVWVRGTD